MASVAIYFAHHFRIRRNLDSISIRSQKYYWKSEPPNSGAHNLDQYTYTCWEYKSIIAWLHHSNLDRFKSEFLNFQLIINNLLDTNMISIKFKIEYLLLSHLEYRSTFTQTKTFVIGNLSIFQHRSVGSSCVSKALE